MPVILIFPLWVFPANFSKSAKSILNWVHLSHVSPVGRPVNSIIPVNCFQNPGVWNLLFSFPRSKPGSEGIQTLDLFKRLATNPVSYISSFSEEFVISESVLWNRVPFLPHLQKMSLHRTSFAGSDPSQPVSTYVPKPSWHKIFTHFYYPVDLSPVGVFTVILVAFWESKEKLF